MAEEELFTPRRSDVAPSKAPRVASSAFVLASLPQVAEDPAPAGSRSESHTLPNYAPRRATGRAYELERNTLALLFDTVPTLTIYGPSIAIPEPGPRVAAGSAYWLPPRASFLEDEPHTQAQVFPHVTRSPGRTAAGSYIIAAQAVVGDAVPLSREVFLDRVPAPPRSPADSYWRQGTFVVQGESPVQIRSFPSVAFPALRAASTAYGLTASFTVQAEPPTTIGQVLPVMTRAAARPAATSFVIAATFNPQAEPSLLTTTLPDRARPPATAAKDVYWLTNRLALDEPIVGTLQIGEPLAMARASWDAYRLIHRLGLDEPIVGAIQIAQPLARERTVATSFVISEKAFDEFLPADRPRGFLDVQPRPFPRAGYGAYWVGLHPVIFESSSGAFVGPFYPERAEVFVAGFEAGERFTPGNEAANELPG